MIPRLYDFHELEFRSIGIGPLTDIMSCTVTEVRNGECLLEAKYPANGIRANEICEYRYITAPYDDSGEMQPFLIYKVKKSLKVIEISAKHVGMINCQMYVDGRMDAEMSIIDRFARLKDDIIGFSYTENGTRHYYYPDYASVLSYYTDIDDIVQTEIKTPTSVRRYIQGAEGSLADNLEYGEIKYDKWQLQFLKERGVDSGVIYRYGVNIGQITGQTSGSEAYTGCVIYSTYDDELKYKPYYWMAAGSSPVKRIPNFKLVDLTPKMKPETIFEPRADSRNTAEIKKKPWNVATNITLTGYELSKMAEYAGKLPVRHIGLCDTIKVIYEPLGISEDVKVVKLVYDVLKERYSSMGLGTIKKTLNSTLRDMMQDVASSMR